MEQIRARLYQPARTAMQSGKAKTGFWRLEFDTAGTRFVEPLMGWTGSTSTLGQVQLDFDTREQALAYAGKHGLKPEIEEPAPRRLHRKAYADNFAYTRIR